MRIIRIRHRIAPWPTGCRWCGMLQSQHPRYANGQFCVANVHTMRVRREWTPPTGAQYDARMRARTERIRRSLA